MNRIQSKDHYIGSYKIQKIYLSFYNYKNLYLKMDTVGHLIFINVLVNHIKIISSNIDNLS